MLKTAKGKEARLQKKTDARGAPVNWETPSLYHLGRFCFTGEASPEADRYGLVDVSCPWRVGLLHGAVLRSPCSRQRWRRPPWQPSSSAVGTWTLVSLQYEVGSWASVICFPPKASDKNWRPPRSDIDTSSVWHRWWEGDGWEPVATSSSVWGESWWATVFCSCVIGRRWRSG